VNFAKISGKFLAILKRDALTAIRYRNTFWVSTAGIALELAAFFYLARAVGPGFRPEGIAYFPFLLVGTGLFGFFMTGITGFVNTVQEAQQSGTFEVLMTTSTSPQLLVMLSAASAFLGRLLFLAGYIVLGAIVFGVPLHSVDWPACLVVVLLTTLLAIAIGVAAAAAQVAIQKGSAVLWILGAGGWFVTGTIFPVSALPNTLRHVADVIPITHALNAMRSALLQSASFTQLRAELMVLSIFVVLLLPFSLLLFSAALNSARRRGTLSFY
jgi:ABC-type polysaccharide/polyol phosphate export permease